MNRRLLPLLSIALQVAAMAFATSEQVTQQASHDIVELNHVYSRSGEYRFRQLIAWDWWQDDFYVSGYQVIHDKEQCVQATPHGELWTVRANGKRLQGREWRETHTLWDPEVLDRDRVEANRRQGLRWQ